MLLPVSAKHWKFELHWGFAFHQSLRRGTDPCVHLLN
jgi:hypothetical protein